MSGKPAARQGDATMYGGPIVQGSAGVFIGAPTGVACSVCPGGMTSGHPVNPLLGAKVLPGETDFALPGPLPFVLSRTYSSYQTKTPAPVGLFGFGWKIAADMRLQVSDNGLILNDNGGRSIQFEPLMPGEEAYSRSESFWLVRGGTTELSEGSPLHGLWQALPEKLRSSPHTYLATNSAQGPWWILGWSERVPGENETLPAPLPPFRILTGLADRYGHSLTYHRDADGEFTGQVTAVTDGAGRQFRLILSTQEQRAEEAREQQFSETLPEMAYGADEGIRLSSVWLVSEPAVPEDEQQPVMLAHYDYTPCGELAAVYDRGGVQVRHFTYDPLYPGRMTGHRYGGRPWMHYRYDSAGRVTEQLNPEGLSYRYQYESSKVTITDSLNRREVLHTEGEGGLKRVVKKEYADGTMTHSQYDPAGRLTAQTDAAGRRTEYRLHVASGRVTAATGHDGRQMRYGYNSRQQLTSTTYPDGLRSSREYDDLGRLKAESSRTGATTRYRYDNPQSELPSSTQDAAGNSSAMTWNRYGQLLTFTDCSGYETRYEYDRFGQQTAVHHEEGISMYRRYDSRGRLTAVTDSEGRETRYEHNDAGDIIAVIGPDGSCTEMQYDGWGNVLSSARGGLTRQIAHDAAGRVTQLVNENGASTTFTYDLLDRVTQQTGFDGRTQRYGYSATGQLVRSEDENLITLWHYDAADRLSHRTVNGEPAEQWRYDERGWLAEISHLSEGHRVTVHYDYDSKGRRISERQTVQDPQTGERLWEHETKQAYSDQGLANRFKPDALPAVEWLTYGSGYIAGMKLGDTPLLEFTRDRLHREIQRSYGTGTYELTTIYTPGGQLQGQDLSLPELNRDYGYDEAGRLVHIRGQHQQSDYGYDAAGRLVSARHHDQMQHSFTDPAGNRVADRDTYPLLPEVWHDNRITQDAEYFYQYDEHGRLRERDESHIRSGDSHVHYYDYDTQHRLTHYRLMQDDDTLTESRYGYDPLGRRICKRVWGNHCGYSDIPGQEYPDNIPAVTWYGWDGDRLTTMQTDTTRIQTIYQPGSFTPLIRVETANTEREQMRHRSLAEVLQQEGSEDGHSVVFPPELKAMLDRLEREIRLSAVSDESRQWLAGCGLTVAQMADRLEAEYEPQRQVHLYHCDHRGLPLALTDADGHIAWRAEFDAWGNMLREENPDNLQQLIRLPGQQYDEESGLYYNRHRYYNPEQGRYITQDPIGLEGGWNPYAYPLNPVIKIDPLGLINFGTGANSVGLAVESAARNLPPEDAQTAINNIISTKGAWNPGDQYVKGLAIGAPTSALFSIYGPAASIGKVIQSGAIFCASNVTYQWVQYGKVKPSDAIAATLTGALYPGRSLGINALISSGIAYLNSGSQSGALGAGTGTVVSGVLGKMPFLSNIFGDYATGLVSEGTSDNVGKNIQ